MFQTASADARPRLGIILVVDQFCADQLTRYESLFTGGIARLRDEGIVFSEAYHDHALTLTATGHATLATGCYPSRHGVVGNNWYERGTGQRVYACDDSTAQTVGDAEAKGRSPRYMMTPALGDWLKESSPHSKVFSVSQKDRSAIMLGGFNADGVFWFDDKTGRFVTSTYYTETLPGWVSSYDPFPFRERAIREGWRKGWPEATYALANPDDSPAENESGRASFPHFYDSVVSVAQTPSEWLLETPYSDEMLLDFTRALIHAERLGRDSIPDLLWVSMSANDYIGHSYGPHSQETLDCLLRVDAQLGHLLATLDSLIGTGQYTVMLSSDHGVMPLPEDSGQTKKQAERILRAENKQQLEAAARRVADALGIAQPLITGQINGLMLNTEIGEEHGIRAPDLRRAVAEAVAKIDYVEDAITYEDLIAPNGDAHGYRAMYRRSFHPDRAPDIAIQYDENVLILDSRYGTTHGTPYRYDTHVPLIFWGQGVGDGPKHVNDRVRTIDAAPTMAAVLGISPSGAVDGSVLRAAISAAGQ